MNTHSEVVSCDGAIFPKPGARPFDRVANLVIVAAQKEIMSQDKFHDCSMVSFFVRIRSSPGPALRFKFEGCCGRSVVASILFGCPFQSRQTVPRCSIPSPIWTIWSSLQVTHASNPYTSIHVSSFDGKVSSLIYSILCNRLPFQRLCVH